MTNGGPLPGERVHAASPAVCSETLAVLVAALGGQGGGVLTEWIVHAARQAGFVVQATSTPGVSQRTGATTYYVEIAPASALPPVLRTAPVPGRVDVLVCAELIEAARMLERGMSTPSRTSVVASTHRVYTTTEKTSGGDARVDSARVIDALRTLSRAATLFDMEEIRARHGTVISAALFGALAGSGALPVERALCEDAIRAGSRGADASLAAFAEAFDRARMTARASPADVPRATTDGERLQAPGPFVTADGRPVPHAIVLAIAALPDEVAGIARIGAAELIDYQDARYADMYLDRVARIVLAERHSERNGHAVAHETALRLARWMRYDDVIRVASRKARRSRLERIRGEANAREGAVVDVYDLFSPSALEIAAILPRRLGARLERRALLRRAQAQSAAHATPPGRGVQWHTSSVTGALTLRAIAALRPLRPRSLRYAREQQAIEDWLVAIEFALTHDRVAGQDAALEIARLPRLIRGYGETHETGWLNYRRILDAYRRMAPIDPVRAAADLRASARAALNDPDCRVREAPAAAAAVRPAAASSPA